MGSEIHPILLCGGSGTRLWPLSRKSYPKQFASLIGDHSLFQQAVMRLCGNGFAAPVIVTNDDFRFIVIEQLAAIGVQAGAILIEPDGRDTAPAVLAAALWISQTDPDALMLVAASDHVVPDAIAFRGAVTTAVSAAIGGALVTFGIQPDRAETGYGWLELNGYDLRSGPEPSPLLRFVEKPDAARAKAMFAAGNYLWNAGIFLFSASSILTAFEDHAARLKRLVEVSLANACNDLSFLRLSESGWNEIEPVSIDYAVMEKADNLVVMPFEAGWSDLGDWQSVWRESQHDAAGVAVFGDALAIDCADTLLRSESDGQRLVGIGLKNIVAIAMKDAVLVADRSRAQDVKLAVTQLRDTGVPQAETFPVDHRPWGWFETLALGERFQVKRIVVKPGGILSLQSHQRRAEHWIVVEGTARVTIGDDVKRVGENQSVYIPLGSRHRLENPGDRPLTLIEVQTGQYFGEDDITRYEDVYARK